MSANRAGSTTRPPPRTGISEQLDAMSITSEGQQRRPVATGSTSSNAAFAPSAKPPKVSLPETFDGTQGSLEEFQMQLRLYFLFNRAQFASEAEKVLYAYSFLRGRASRGLRPYLKDWLDCHGNEGTPRTETRLIFHDYEQFEIKLDELYGIPNEETYADRHIRRLRQTTSVASYASEFQRYAADLGRNDAALRSQFYLGLKDAVKAELSRGRGVTSMTAMVKSAREIDERLQELKSDRLMYADPGRGRSFARRDPYGPEPMELDATRKGPERSSGRNRKVRCYRCQHMGHIARDCNKISKGLVQNKELNSMEAYNACTSYFGQNAAELRSERADSSRA